MKIRTVCGDIAPEELGFTLIHEHVIQDISPLCGQASPSDISEDRLTLDKKNLIVLRDGGWMMSKESLDVKGDD